MPLYEYYCSDCKSRFELLCMKCHSEKVRRLLSVFAFAGSDSEGSSFDDMGPSTGTCACGGGSCGCN